MGWWINGIAANDLAGYAVASAGDVNGDGMDDIIISAYTSDPGGRIYADQVYVIFGASSFPIPFKLASLDGSNGFIIYQWLLQVLIMLASLLRL